MPVHGIDNGNNKHEVYTTEELLAILQQAIDTGSLQGIDPEKNPIVAAVRESHNNSEVTFWSGTEAEFNALSVTSELVGARIGSDGKLYILTGDTTLSDTVEAARQAALEATEGMKREVISVTLRAEGWSNTAPYTQTVAVSGMTADKDFLAPFVAPTGSETDDIAAQVALSCISGGSTGTDTMTFYCYDEKPTTTITVFMVDKGTKLESGDFPIASASQLGVVKVGAGLNIDEGGTLTADFESATPLPAASVDDMTDTSRIYVNTTDGKWYYYDGESWTAGGTYQATELANGSVKIQHLDEELKGYHLFETDWTHGSTGNNRTDRIRLFNNTFFPKGTIFEFDANGTNLQWAVDYSANNTTYSNVLAWGTTARYEVTQEGFYNICIRHSNNWTIDADEIASIGAHVEIYRPIRNTAGRMLDWYADINPFEITEKVSSNGTGSGNYIRIVNFNYEQNCSYWMSFGNLIEFYNRVNWAGGGKKDAVRLMTYDLSSYGTTSTANNVDGFDIVLPNNQALVLNVITGVMSVKSYRDAEDTDAILLRNAKGNAVCGAFKEIYDYFQAKYMKADIDELKASPIGQLGRVSNNNANYLFVPEWEIGSVNLINGLYNQDKCARFPKKYFFEKGTIIEFEQGASASQWAWQLFANCADDSVIRNSGWLTSTSVTLESDGYYCLVTQYQTDSTLTDEDVAELSSRIKIYRPWKAQNLFDAPIDYDLTIRGVNHRGWYLAPENTLPAYERSKKNGFKYVECDVSFTADNVPVLLHDDTIDRTSNGTGNINNLTFAQVREYDFGSWKAAEYAGTRIPSLEEFVIYCRNIGLIPYIELKNSATYSEAQIQSIVDLVNQNGMKGKVAYISFNATYLNYVKNYDADARLGYVVNTIDSNVITTANSLKTDTNEVFIDSNYGSLNADRVALCVNADLPLEVWTADSSSAIENLSPYVSGVTSNKIIAGKLLFEKNINA